MPLSPDIIKIKNPDIPILESYASNPDSNFWEKFPKNYDTAPSSKIKIDILERKKLNQAKDSLTSSQYLRGLKAISYLKNGAPSFQKSILPPCVVKNTPSSIKNGILVTDSIASWIKKKFVCSPFDYPPLPKFRSNCLMAIEQNEKLRLVLNVSLPEDCSLNSNIAKEKIEKILESYASNPNSNFWEKFPKNYDTARSSKIKIDILEKKLDQAKDSLTSSQYLRGLKAISYLKNGAPSFQKTILPPCVVKNTPSSIKNGILVTDSIASWIKKKFVCGPFDYPPLPKFRSNCLMAIEQSEKLRLVLNVSLPEDCSLNSNIVKEKIEKIRMSSARSFGYSVMKAGPGAIMSKFDLWDAYKIASPKIIGFKALSGSRNISMRTDRFLVPNLLSRILTFAEILLNALQKVHVLFLTSSFTDS